MTEITLNKCLNGLDEIIFHDFENRKDIFEIIEILNNARKYIIDSTLIHNREYNQSSFIITLEFINYLIQEAFHPITNQFVNYISNLRELIIRLKNIQLDIKDDEKVDFDIACNSFINKHIISQYKNI